MLMLMQDSTEINDILSRSYGVPENIDEEDLMSGAKSSTPFPSTFNFDLIL